MVSVSESEIKRVVILKVIVYEIIRDFFWICYCLFVVMVYDEINWFVMSSKGGEEGGGVGGGEGDEIFGFMYELYIVW